MSGQNMPRSNATLIPAPKGYPIKLVRDNTPQILNDSGEPGDLWYGEANGDRSRWLRLKLAEEVGEYLVDGGWGELRDVLAVVEGLAHEHGQDLAALVGSLNADPRGGFVEGVMMFGYHPEFDAANPSTTCASPSSGASPTADSDSAVGTPSPSSGGGS